LKALHDKINGTTETSGTGKFFSCHWEL